MERTSRIVGYFHNVLPRVPSFLLSIYEKVRGIYSLFFRLCKQPFYFGKALNSINTEMHPLELHHLLA